MSLSPRLSVAVTLKLSPFLMSCVSAPANWMVGDMRSRCTPPGCPAGRTPPTADLSRVPAAYQAPGLLPGVGRHQVVDDVRRDQNQQVAPRLRLRAESEQLADDRQVYKKRYSGLHDIDGRHSQAADHRCLPVVDQDLVVRLLRLEREADVH